MALIMSLVLLVFSVAMIGVDLKKDANAKSFQNQQLEEKIQKRRSQKDADLPTPGREIFLNDNNEDAVKQRFFDMRFECLDAIQDDMTEVFGEDWKSLFEQYPCRLNLLARCPSLGRKTITASEFSFGNIWNMAYQIWLSKQGFTLWYRKKYTLAEIIEGADIRVEKKECTSDTLIESANREKEEIKAKNKALIYRACKVIERNLRAKHPGKAIRLACGKSTIGEIKNPETHLEIFWGESKLIWTRTYSQMSEHPTKYPW